MKGPKSIMDKVQAYMKEKASSYARAPASVWDKDNRKPVEKMTPSESRQIMTGSNLPVSRGMARLMDNDELPEGHEYKAKQAGDGSLFGE